MMQLPETKNYHVVVRHSDEYSREVYNIVNKFTGVVEFVTPSLPQVFVILEQFEDVLAAMSEVEVEEEKAPNMSNVIDLFKGRH